MNVVDFKLDNFIRGKSCLLVSLKANFNAKNEIIFDTLSSNDMIMFSPKVLR